MAGHALGRAAPVPFILWVESTERDTRSRNRLIEFLKRGFIRRCSAFVVPGKSSLLYVKNYGALEKDIFTAPNAVDTELFAQQAGTVRQEPERRREALQLPPRFFLFVGRLVREKGVFDLLEAYGKLTPESRTLVSLVLVGDGAAREEVIRRAQKISPGQVRCAGFVQRDQLAGYYALAKALSFHAFGHLGAGGKRSHGLRSAGNFERRRRMCCGPGPG